MYIEKSYELLLNLLTQVVAEFKDTVIGRGIYN